LAHTNKSLAWSNKSGNGVKATKGYQPEGDLGEAKNKHLLPPPQSEEAEFDPALLTRGPHPHSPPSLRMGPLPSTVSRCHPQWGLYIAAVALRNAVDGAALIRPINKPTLGRVHVLWVAAVLEDQYEQSS
jgi:hypothetical protein